MLMITMLNVPAGLITASVCVLFVFLHRKDDHNCLGKVDGKTKSERLWYMEEREAVRRIYRGKHLGNAENVPLVFLISLAQFVSKLLNIISILSI